jgi:hypothetical protein
MKKPSVLHLVIDSNNLRQDRGFLRADTKFLIALSKLSLIKLHLPWFIYKECTTTYIQDITLTLDHVINKLQNAYKKGLHESESDEINKTTRQLRKIKAKVLLSVEAKWADFIKDTGAILYPYDPKDSTIVFDAYFKGATPFKSLKSRLDIPDAFIFQTLLVLASKYVLHFVSGDNEFRAKCKETPNIITYANLQEFFSSKEFSVTQEYYEAKGKKDIIKSELLTREENIKETVEYYVEHISNFDFTDPHFHSENGEITINAIDVTKIELLKDEIRIVDNTAYIPCIVCGDASVDYFMYISDYWVMDDNERPSSYRAWNEYYYLIDEVLPIQIRLTVHSPVVEFEGEIDFEIGVITEIDEVALADLPNKSNLLSRNSDL